jgi:hypothetical protein
MRCLAIITKLGIWKNSLIKKFTKQIPSYIESIKIIDVIDHNVYDSNSTLKYLSNSVNTEKYYVLTIWNNKAQQKMYYLVNNTILRKLYHDTSDRHFIDIIAEYHNKYINNNIFSILISGKDVTHIFDKFKASIAIPKNLTAHVLYLYYCKIYNIQPLLKKSLVSIIDFDLDEKIYKYSDFIQ